MKRAVVLALGLFSMLVFGTASGADELKILSPVAMKPILTKVGTEFEQSTGHRIVVTWAESGAINADIQKGVPFDVAVLTPNFLDALAKQGKIDPATRTPLARSGLGVAVRKGAPKPDVSTTEAFKRTLRNPRSIGVAEGSATSRYLGELFARLGIAEEMKGKITFLPGAVQPFVAKGDVEIAITQVGAIVPFDGLDLAGRLPADIQLYTAFIAVASPASASDTVRTLMKALASPAKASVLQAAVVEPPS